MAETRRWLPHERGGAPGGLRSGGDVPESIFGAREWPHAGDEAETWRRGFRFRRGHPRNIAPRRRPVKSFCVRSAEIADKVAS